MRMNSMVNRTGWYEHAIIDWLARFQEPPQMQSTDAAERALFKSQPTPRKTNMSPENQWLEDVFPIKILPS